MKKRIHSMAMINWLIKLSLALIFFANASTASAAPLRVAILPFEINAAEDLSYLQEGILDMLSSRLTWKDKVDVIDKYETRSAVARVEGFEGESRALLVGGKLAADYVLFGSLTVFDGCVSIDGKMVDVSSRQQPYPFFARTDGLGDVIPKINAFASDINATVFGRDVPKQQPSKPVQPTTGQPQQQPDYDPRMHPEKLLQPRLQ